MGVSDPTTWEGLLEAVPKGEEQAKLFMLEALVWQYQDHGNNVIKVMRKTAEYLTPEQEISIPAQASVSDAVGFGSLRFDGLENPTLDVRLSPETVDNQIAQSDESLVCMSFELGHSVTYSLYDERLKYPKMGRYFRPQKKSQKKANGTFTDYFTDYEGNKISKKKYNHLMEMIEEIEVVLFEPLDRDIKFVDGYVGEQTFDNLQKLTQIVQKYPDKMFVAIGGNPAYLEGVRMPDIRDARARLEKQGQWPDNLIMVGFEAVESGQVLPASLGDDIYVSAEDLKILGFSQAVSNVSPVVTEIVRILVDKGINSHQEVKDCLYQMTQTEVTSFGQEEVNYRLLDLGKVKKDLAKLGKK